ncbi:hypothetical protein C1H76_2442 [Elsinoe australis]|uniref:Uncharacterized protein n=1 Tax=Elsinoe australis TaxID=40998 RepID=A0A4V6DUP1_9PEZI|nr:hypothetical protein C1H76_2442 [Elsinoe australis]
MTSNGQQKVFSGRGGAGNIAPLSPALQPQDLETPTIKQSNYTTGRGGSGNIVSNDSAENARKAQDVEASAAARKAVAGEDGNSKGGYFGRGGAANIVKKVKEEVKEKVGSNGNGKEKEGDRKGSAEGKTGK